MGRDKALAPSNWIKTNQKCDQNPMYPSGTQKTGHVGGVLKMSGPADFKSVPGFDNWPRFIGVIEQNKISNSFCHYCIC